MLLNGPFWSSRPRTSSHGTAPGGGETLPVIMRVPCNRLCRWGELRMERATSVARMERSVIRDRRCHWQGRSRITLRSIRATVLSPTMTPGVLPDALQRAPRDRHPAAGSRDAVGGDLFVEDLIDRGLLVGVHVARCRVVIDRPLGALRIEPLVDRPDAGLGHRLPRIFHRFAR